MIKNLINKCYTAGVSSYLIYNYKSVRPSVRQSHRLPRINLGRVFGLISKESIRLGEATLWVSMSVFPFGPSVFSLFFGQLGATGVVYMD